MRKVVPGSGCKGTGLRIATASVRTGLAMTGLFGAVRGRRREGSESSAASGRCSESSEWPRSKLGASVVRQRRNFGHRNRVIRNTPVQIQRGTDCHTSDIGHWFAMTGSFTWGAVGGRTEASALRTGYKKCGTAGRCGHRPLRMGYKKCGTARCLRGRE